jgi:two-component system NarL family sensor kinase
VGFSSSDRSSSTPGGGFGLTGMGERAKLLGGELSMKSIPGRGTTVVVEFRRSS